MASITIRNIDAHTKARPRARAAHRQRSMEEEALNILRTALAENDTAPGDLAAAIGARSRPLGGVDLAIPARETVHDPQRWRLRRLGHQSLESVGRLRRANE